MPQLEQAQQAQQAPQAQTQPASTPQQPPSRPAARGSYDDMNTPASARKGRDIAKSYVNRGPGAAGGDEEASSEEQAEYERATGALTKVLYEDDNTSQAVMDQLRPEEKVGSVAKASMMLIQQLDERLDLDEAIIAQFSQEVADRVIDLYENVHADEFSDQESQQVWGATWEGVMELFGVDEEAYEEFTQGLSDEDMDGYETQYKEFLGG